MKIIIKRGRSYFAYSNKRKMAEIAYPNKRNSQKSLIVISIFCLFLASAGAEHITAIAHVIKDK